MRRVIFVVMVLASLSTSTAMAGLARSTQAGAVEVELRLNKAIYSPGEPVEIALTLVNRASEGITFQFNTGQMYDFIVLSEDRSVWQWSHGRAFTQALTTLALKPNESKLFREHWDQRDAKGQQVPAGKYEMIAVFPARGGLGVRPGPDGPRVRFSVSSGSGSLKPQLPSVSSRSTTLAGSSIGEVLVNDRPVLRIRMAAGGISASDRAAIVAARLQHMLARGLKPEELAVTARRGETGIEWKGELVVTVDANHASLNNTTPRALARKWLQTLTQGLSG